MRISTPITALALAATLAAGASPAIAQPSEPVAPETGSSSTPADGATAGGDVKVRLPAWGFYPGSWYYPPLETCPAHAPYLTDENFHAGSGWNVPKGIEIRSRDSSTLGVTIWPATKEVVIDGRTWIRQSGIAATSSITNYRGGIPWEENNWVEITLHCTN